MAFVHADRVKETSTTTGTGTYSLAGAVTGFRTFVAGVGTGNRCTYCAEDGTDWEINEGTVTDATPDTLTRARLLASSTGSAINWAAGTRNLFAVYAAADTNPRVKALTGDYTNNSTTGTEVTGLSVDLEPGAYSFEYKLILRTDTAGTGMRFGINFTGTQTALTATLEYPSTGVSASSGVIDDDSAGATDQLYEAFVTRTVSTTTPDLGPLTGFATANVDHFAMVNGIIVVTVAGQLELWAADETGTAVTRVNAGSMLILHRGS